MDPVRVALWSWTHGLISLEGAVVFCYLGILLVVALIDWDTQIIYNRFHIIIAILAAAQIFLVPEHGIGDRLIGALIVSVPMLVLALIVPGAFGGGDIKLMAASGLFLGHGRHCLRHVFRPAFRRRLRGLYAGHKTAEKERPVRFRAFSGLWPGRGSPLGRPDRSLVSERTVEATVKWFT